MKMRTGAFDRWMLLVLVGLALGFIGVALVVALAGLPLPEPVKTLVSVRGPVGLAFAQKM